MKNKLKHIVVFALVAIFGWSSIAQENWDEIKNKEGITVFTRTNNVMSFKEFKATMTVAGKVNDFLSVLYDVEGLTSWGYNLTMAKLLERKGDSLQIYYAVAKAPWPYKDRDGIYSNKIHWDTPSKTLFVDIELLEKGYDAVDEFVRMDGYGFWRIKQLSSNEMEVDFQMQIDPGGSIKSWMANMVAGDSPYHTLLGLKEALKNSKYQGKSYDILKK
jgi:hypothetical protein